MEALRKFEGSSLDELLEHVYRECGPQARIVEANRTRRGGVGGFFAKEGYEVVVEPDPGHQPGAALPEPPPPPPAPAPPPPGRATLGGHLDLVDTAEDDDELVADIIGRTGRSEPVSARAEMNTSAPVQVPAQVSAQTPTPELSASTGPSPAWVPTTDETSTAARLTRLLDEEEARERAQPFSFDEVLEEAMAEPEPGLDVQAPPAGPGVQAPQAAVEDQTEDEAEAADDAALDQAVLMGDMDEELTMTSRVTDQDVNAMMAARAAAVPGPTDQPVIAEPDPPVSSEPVMPPAPKIHEPGPPAPRRPRDTTHVARTRSGEAMLTVSEPHPPGPAGAPVPERPEEDPTPEEAGSQALALAAHYARVPQAPELPAGPGAVAVVGYRNEALARAERVARERGPGTVVLLATSHPAPGDAASAVMTNFDDATERCRPKGKTGRRGRTNEQLVVAVDLGLGPSGLLWAQRLLSAIKAEQVRLAVNAEENRDDTDATIQLLGCVDTIDIMLPEDGVLGLDPTWLLELTAPVSTIAGLPATAGLWAALTLEFSEEIERPKPSRIETRRGDVDG